MDNIISGINVSGQVYTILDPNAIHESEFSAYSGAVDTSLSSKASQTTVDALNDVVTAHTADTSIHLTSGDIETIISSQTADFVTGEELSSYTYDKATIDSKIASGGTFDPTQYYNKTATDELLAEKLDASAYTPTDLSNYYNKQEVDGIVASAKTEIEGEIPSLSGYATEQWVEDKHYITGVDLSNYSTTEQMNGAISAATSGLQPTLSAGTGIDITDNVISATGGGSTYTAGRAIYIDSGNTISFGLPISAGTGINALIYNHTGNTASGNYSHAEGQKTQANGIYSHAEGYSTKAEVNTSHAEGAYTIASGTSSHAEGYSATTSGYASHAECYSTQANGNYSHAEGNSTKSNGQNSHAEGNNTVASGNASHAEGQSTVANSQDSHAEGYYSSAMTFASHAEGNSTVASGQSSHAEGYNSQANDQNSHAEGFYTQANGSHSHSEGDHAVASGYSSHAEGQSTQANGQNSHAEGTYTVANNDSEHASGYYNVSNTGSSNADETLFSVGNGTADNRHNAFEIRKNGDIYIVSGVTDIKLQDHLGGGGTTYSAGTGIDITNNVISAKIWCGTQAEYEQILVKDPNTLYLIHS